MSLKKTPLYDNHIKLGATMVDYAGWSLPVKFEDLIPEHNAVRNAAGLFDVSHMGEIIIKGKDAKQYVNYLMSNDIDSISVGQIIYTFMCDEDGTVVDDLLVYKFKEDNYYLVVNGANVDKDVDWINAKSKGFDVEVDNISPKIHEIAFQGPYAESILQKITDYDLDSIKFFHFVDDVEILGTKTMISRTGYTGEDGFEIYTEDEEGIVKIWNKLLELGKDIGVKSCGLGCRDTLRFEAALPLYGHEISDKITPIEGGFKFFVKTDIESDFIGKQALKKQIDEGTKRILCGFELIGKGIPRENYIIEKDSVEIGHVTTGYLSPTLGKAIGNALVDREFSSIGTEFDIVVRKKKIKAKVISKRFVKGSKKK